MQKFPAFLCISLDLPVSPCISLYLPPNQAALPVMQKLPAFTRKKILNFCVDAFRARFEAFAYALCREAGKPIKDARGEVTRLIDT